MHILFLLTQDLESPSGVGRYFPLAIQLASIGNQITICGLHPNYKNLVDRHLTVNNVAIHFVDSMHIVRAHNVKRSLKGLPLIWLGLHATISLFRASQASRADLIIIGKPHPMNSLAGLATKFLNKTKLIVDYDDYEVASMQFSSQFEKVIVKFFEDNMPRWADLLTTNTHFNQNRLCSLGIHPQKIYFLSNGIILSRYQTIDDEKINQLRKDLKLEGNRVVIFIGSLSMPSHPVHLLLKAFKKVHDRIENTTLLLVGGGNSYKQLQSEAQDLGISDCVRFIGRVSPEDVPNYYRLAEVSVDPIMDDDAARGRQPLKLFESWAANIPFITGDVGDRKELAGKIPAIYLYTPTNADSIAEALITVLTNNSIKQNLVRQGAARVREYDWKNLADRFSKVIQEVTR